MPLVATETTRVELDEDRTIVAGSQRVHSITVDNASANDVEVTFTDTDATTILTIAVLAGATFNYEAVFMLDNGLKVVGLFDSSVSVTVTRSLEDTAAISDVAMIDTKAIDFKSSERLLNSTDQTLGFSSEWSIQLLLNPDNVTAAMMPLEIKQLSPIVNAGMIQVYMGGNEANDPFRVTIRKTTTGVGIIKRYDWHNSYSADTNVYYLFTWNGTDLVMYIDGVLTEPDVKGTDSSGAMANADRSVAIGGLVSGASFKMNGQVHSTSIWDVVLGQDAVTSLANSGSPENIDNRYDTGDYSSSVNLVHYWRHGFDASQLGRDYGTGTAIDLTEDSENITAADIVDY